MGKCTIRPNPDDPRPETWPCAAEGCGRRVKTDGARCPVHRGMMNRGVRRGAGRTPDEPWPRRPMRPAAPTDAATPDEVVDPRNLEDAVARGAYASAAREDGRVRDGRDLVKRRIEALTVYDVIASKAARKVLVGLGRALLAMFDKPEAR